MSEVLNLSDINGYARLYVTLLAKSAVPQRRLGEEMYDWYAGNIEEYNAQGLDRLSALSKEEFWDQISRSGAEPYKTDVQLVKALRLLQRNMSFDEKYAGARDTIIALFTMHAREFRQRTGYTFDDRATAYARCEETLDPSAEPEFELDLMSIVRSRADGKKLVYICAPLRGNISYNLGYAADRAREVFLNGDIPVCPHLLFAPIADPRDPTEDEQAMQMCFKLIERCDELAVFGHTVSPGMSQEIEHAEKLGVPVFKAEEEVRRQKPNKTKDSPCR
ncbi:MAG: DUF4406 domain-containing protein [Oscillospiraceae bacterium]|nr:DUF4406 domain-containing protein [Oscillospiraceae bacterium]